MKRLILIALLIISVMAMGCSRGSDANSANEPSTKISGRTTYEEPTIDKSYDVGRTDEPAKTTTRTTTSTPSTPTRTTTTEPSMSDEDRAKKIASDYIKTLAGYKYYGGRQLHITNVVKTSDDGNWIIDANFIRDAQMSKYESEEPINVHLNIRKWKANSYEFN